MIIKVNFVLFIYYIIYVISLKIGTFIVHILKKLIVHVNFNGHFNKLKL